MEDSKEDKFIEKYLEYYKNSEEAIAPDNPLVDINDLEPIFTELVDESYELLNNIAILANKLKLNILFTKISALIAYKFENSIN